MMTFLLTISTDFFWAFWLSAVSDPLFTSFHKSSSLQPVNKVVKYHLTSTHYLWECGTHKNKGGKKVSDKAV